MANNHAMQHGAKAYDEVLRYLENSNVQYAGPKEKRLLLFGMIIRV